LLLRGEGGEVRRGGTGEGQESIVAERAIAIDGAVVLLLLLRGGTCPLSQRERERERERESGRERARERERDLSAGGELEGGVLARLGRARPPLHVLRDLRFKALSTAF
jgi:hypothetical protein